MSAFFLVVLLAGLLLGVFAMLFGTEHVPRNITLPAPHERTSEHVIDAEPSALFNRASMAALASVCGVTGYLLTRFSDWSVGVRLVVAALAGAGAMALQSLIIARWAIPSARAEHIDERYLLQGTIGRVTRAIPPGGDGEIQYTLDGVSYTLPARGVDAGELVADVEVVLDRIEVGVAYVEPWAQVEQRL